MTATELTGPTTLAESATTVAARATMATLEQIHEWPATVGIPQASEQAFGFSRSWGYELEAAGEFPCKTLRIRGRTRVIVSSLIRVLEGGEP